MSLKDINKADLDRQLGNPRDYGNVWDSRNYGTYVPFEHSSTKPSAAVVAPTHTSPPGGSSAPPAPPSQTRQIQSYHGGYSGYSHPWYERVWPFCWFVDGARYVFEKLWSATKFVAKLVALIVLGSVAYHCDGGAKPRQSSSISAQPTGHGVAAETHHPVRPPPMQNAVAAVVPPRIGVSLGDMSSQQAYRLGMHPAQKGALVVQVERGGPAQRAGLRAGDVIIEVMGLPVTNWQNAQGAIRAQTVGAIVPVTVVHPGNWAEVVLVRPL